MIEIFEDHAITAADNGGMTLIHHALNEDAIDCAEVLFQHAYDQQTKIKLGWDKGKMSSKRLSRNTQEHP